VSDPAYVEVYSLTNDQQIINVTALTSSSNSVKFSCVLPGGRYGFRFYYVDFGYATCADNVSITINQPSISTLKASYNYPSKILTNLALHSHLEIILNIQR
jgi:hypothetical protein